MIKRTGPFAVAITAALALAWAVGAGAKAVSPHVCSGSLGSPGLLKGSYPNGVIVKGVCAVKSGKAHVIGTLTVTKNGVLGAIWGLHHASLTVTGNVVLAKGAIAFIGCKVNSNGSGFPCVDDPNQKKPTLTSHATITGSITENSPIGVVIHNTTIGGSVTETGGGGGLSCNPPTSGVFAKFMSPIYSDYEDTSVGGSIKISELDSCWLGIARVKVKGSVTIKNNDMGDPDAIEIIANNIKKNLSCSGNDHPGGPPGTMPVWDSADSQANPPGTIFPRISVPNTVGGSRSGQCVTASPITLGGPPAASHF